MRGPADDSIYMKVGRLLAVLVAVLALGACGDDDDSNTGDASEAWDKLSANEQQQACAAVQSSGASAAAQQLSAKTDGKIDTTDASTVLKDKC